MIWGAPKFWPKNHSVFLSKFRWSQKTKRSSLILRRFFSPNWGDQVISKKKAIYLFFTFLLISKKRKVKEKRGLGGHAEHFRGAKLPKKFEIAQNFDAKLPKNMKLPEVLTRDRHLKIKRGGQFPPRPPHLLLHWVSHKRFYAPQSSIILRRYRLVSRAGTRSSLVPEVWGSNLGPVKLHTVLPTARHRWDISSKGAVLPGRNDADVGSATSLHALAKDLIDLIF